MGFHITDMQLNVLFQTWQTNYHIYAPRNFSGGGRFSDTDCIRYGKIEHADEIVFDKKSDYSFKEVLTPVSQTLFFFTEGQTKEADFPQKGAVIFLRSCDLYALKRLDDMYLHNSPADYYYQHLRDNIKIVLMGCEHSFENCFCVSMGTNVSTKYDMSIDRQPDGTYLESDRCVSCGACVKACKKKSVEALKPVNFRPQRDERRCIGCGECVLACPNAAWTRSEKKYYRLTLLGRTGKKNPRLGEDFIKWVDEDSIIKIILNTYDYVKEYIDPNAPGGKEHIGYIVDRTGFEEFKRWALRDVTLPEIAEVMTPMYWKGITY